MSALLSTVSGNEKFRLQNNAYYTVAYIGFTVMVVGMLLSMVDVDKEKTSPVIAYTSLGLGIGGALTSGIFFGVQRFNQHRAVEKYNMYVIGIKKAF